MGAKAIKLGSWNKHPVYILLGFECPCVAYAQWNKCDCTINSTESAAKLNYRRLTEINCCYLIARIYFSEH